MKWHNEHGTSYVVALSAMSPSQDDVSIKLAMRIADAIAAGDRDEHVQLTRELENALTTVPTRATNNAPSFSSQPAVIPMAQTPAPTRSAWQVVAGALAEIGVACRARVVTDYAEARRGPVGQWQFGSSSWGR